MLCRATPDGKLESNQASTGFVRPCWQVMVLAENPYVEDPSCFLSDRFVCLFKVVLTSNDLRACLLLFVLKD